VSPDGLPTLQAATLFALFAVGCGIRLYFVVFVAGLASRLHYFPLPPNLDFLETTWLLAALGFMVVVEFVADKMQMVDTAWDTFHTFVRIPVGALLAAGAVGDTLGAQTILAGLLGGTVTAATHFTKAGGRALINYKAPDFLNTFTSSFGEDFGMAFATWLALHHPRLFLAAFLVVLAVIAVLLPKLWPGVVMVAQQLKPKPKPAPPAPGGTPAPGQPPQAQPAQAAQPFQSPLPPMPPKKG
jgi:hypothetical protein